LRSDSLLLVFPLAVSVCLAQPALPPQHETVVVTGTYAPLSLEEIDRTLTVLLAREQALLLDSLADLLALDPSLDLRQRAADGVQADLSIRGSSFGQTLVLLNGQRMNDAQSGHHDMDIPVPLEAVSRVEVLRGSGSTMYGSDAVAGAVNIITTPPEGAEIRLRTAFGNFGANQQSVSLAGSAGRVSEQLVAARDFSPGFMPDRDYRNLQLTSTTHFATGLGSGDVTLGYMDHPFGADQFYGNFNSWENTKTWLAAWRQELGKKTTASFSFRRHSDLFVLYRDQPAVFANHHADEGWLPCGGASRSPLPSRCTTAPRLCKPSMLGSLKSVSTRSARSTILRPSSAVAALSTSNPEETSTRGSWPLPQCPGKLPEGTH
jgi:iron complex outermembrane receptor protein